jgi:hypothetical protein
LLFAFAFDSLASFIFVIYHIASSTSTHHRIDTSIPPTHTIIAIAYYMLPPYPGLRSYAQTIHRKTIVFGNRTTCVNEIAKSFESETNANIPSRRKEQGPATLNMSEILRLLCTALGPWRIYKMLFTVYDTPDDSLGFNVCRIGIVTRFRTRIHPPVYRAVPTTVQG